MTLDDNTPLSSTTLLIISYGLSIASSTSNLANNDVAYCWGGMLSYIILILILGPYNQLTKTLAI